MKSRDASSFLSRRCCGFALRRLGTAQRLAHHPSGHPPTSAILPRSFPRRTHTPGVSAQIVPPSLSWLASYASALPSSKRNHHPHSWARLNCHYWAKPECQNHLAPTLQPSDVIIPNNLGSYIVQGVQTAIEAVGAILRYLQPYSPDFNPIENLFSKLKGLLRGDAKRSTEALWQEIGDLLDKLSPNECRNYLAAAGYVNA